MWPLLEPNVNPARCDLLFTEDINRRMRVPSRLTVPSSFNPVDEEPTPEDIPNPVLMHVPVRIFPAETTAAGLRPILLDRQRSVPTVGMHMSLDSSAQPAALGEVPFLPGAGRWSTQSRRRSGRHSSRLRRQSHHGNGLWWERTSSDSALPGPAQHLERPDVCPPPTPLPLLTETGRIYSVQNIFQTMYLLGQVLFHRVRSSLQDPVPPSSQEAVPALESSPEAIAAEAAAMKKELTRISERLCVLEEQYKAWRKEEPLIYSMLISACLVNTWLWLWR